MKNITMKFGLISGAIVVLYSGTVLAIFGDFSKMSPSQFQMVEAFGYLRYLILILTIFFAMWTLKKNSEELLKYWVIVLQGIIVTFVVSLCIGLMESIYIMLNPDFYAQFGKMYIEQMKASDATDLAIANATADMNNYKWMQSPMMTGLFYFFETVIIGSVASLIIARFLKTKRSIVSNNFNS